MRKVILFGAALTLVLAAGGGADAGPLPGAPSVGSARKEVRDAREALREARDGGKDAAGAIENLKKAQDKLHETRVDRRKTHVQDVRAKWKALIGSADARSAIKVHARREARLHRMKALATELGKPEMVTRIDALIVKEQTRFDKKMEEVRTKEEKK